MIRLFKWLATLVIGVILGGVLLLLFGIDGITRTLVERQTSKALGVPVSLESSSIKFFDERVDLGQLTVANPEGFAETPFFLRFDTATADLALRDLTQSHIELEKLLLETVEIHLDRADGRSNYRVILDNLDAYQEERGDGGDRTFLIREVVIRDIRVSARLLPFGGNLTRRDLVIDEIVLENVGSGEEAAGLGHIAAVITTAILSAVLQQGSDLFPSDLTEDLGKGLGELGGILQAAEDVIRGIGEIFQRGESPD